MLGYACSLPLRHAGGCEAHPELVERGTEPSGLFRCWRSRAGNRHAVGAESPQNRGVRVALPVAFSFDHHRKVVDLIALMVHELARCQLCESRDRHHLLEVVLGEPERLERALIERFVLPQVVVPGDVNWRCGRIAIRLQAPISILSVRPPSRAHRTLQYPQDPQVEHDAHGVAQSSGVSVRDAYRVD